MAHSQGTPARAQRLIALAATVLLAAATAFALGRVFLGHAATWRLLMAALASAVLACLMERRNLLVATLVSAIAMLVAVGLLVFPSTTWHGLPSLETLRAIAEAARLVGEQARIQVAPTAPLAPLMLAALTATWAAIFSAHALAFRAGSPLLALLPPVALIAFADTVLEEFVKPLYGLAFLVAALVVVFADGLRRVQGWGPVWTGPGRAARVTSTAARRARRVAATAVGVALVSPILLPGFGSKAILDFSSANDDRVRIDLLVNVANALSRTVPLPVFTVTTSQPSYYRLAALPQFDGSGWSPAPAPPLTDILAGAPLPLVPGTDAAVVSSAEHIQESFQISTDSLVPYLPAGYQPLSVQTSLDGVRWDPVAGALTVDPPESGVDAGLQYQVTALRIQPSPAQLRALTLPPPVLDSGYTALPDLPPQIHDLATRWTTGATTTYDQIIAIQEELRSSGDYQYDANVAPRNSADALVDFLTRNRVGICQQFAGAMAVLLRELGIPARVAVGFTPGAPIDNGTASDPSMKTYEVTTDEAHAWVEVLFPAYGWLAFEPTPGRDNPVAEVYTDPAAPTCTGKGCSNPTHGSTKGKQGLNTAAVRENAHPQQLDPARGSSGRGGRRGSFGDITLEQRWLTARKLLLLALGLAALILLLIPPTRAWRRRRRLRRAAGEPRRLILATYDVFTERAAELGFPRGIGETLEEYRRRVTGSGLLRDGHLDRLSTITAAAAYAPRPPGQEDAREATAAADTALHELRKGTPLGRRILGHYRREG